MLKIDFTEELWRKLFIIVNSLFIVFNIIMLAISSTALDTLLKYDTIIHVTPPAIYGTVLFTSILGTIASSIGFIGLWKKLNIIAIVHLSSLSVTMLMNICIAIAAAATQDNYNTSVQQSLLNAIKSYKQPQYGEEFDKLHTNFYCCGATSYKNFKENLMKIPQSCRVGELTYATGCIEEVVGFAQYQTSLLIAFCFISALIQGAYLGISIWMLRKSNKDIGLSA
ncbi:hypothetical protein MN116_002650 [Schistosoma mekongi]|uniref:25 kDa integral membrane protein n=1 Tax=Schistosoma mekongi TaxID=38744 RepID=A0AAE1ZHR8_SCHME|nr:hypothetical protein MN116_002650 [Schistosoma mekongi]